MQSYKILSVSFSLYILISSIITFCQLNIHLLYVWLIMIISNVIWSLIFPLLVSDTPHAVLMACTFCGFWLLRQILCCLILDIFWDLIWRWVPPENVIFISAMCLESVKTWIPFKIKFSAWSLFVLIDNINFKLQPPPHVGLLVVMNFQERFSPAPPSTRVKISKLPCCRRLWGWFISSSPTYWQCCPLGS